MPQRRRRSPAEAAAAAAIGGLLLVATGACSTDPSPEQPMKEPTVPTAEPTPLADYDTSEVAVVRAAFCDRVSDDAIAAAVSDVPSEDQTWRPGGRLPGSKDISNEFGCAWTAGQVSARAWVFAPPITPERAVDLASEVVDGKCQRVRNAPDLGAPSVAQQCAGEAGKTGIYGLVGDAWVSCELSGLTGSAVEDVELVGQWCVAVLEALRTA